jgi:GNAT superfamily N-acetyltransferase
LRSKETENRLGSIAIGRARGCDADVVAAMRVASHTERHPQDDPAENERFADACRAFFAIQLGARSPFLCAWIAWDVADHDRPIGSATLTLVPTLPRLGESGPLLDARVRNVYVVPSSRRRGVARALMLALLGHVAELGIRRLTLGSSRMGRPLYESLGFIAKSDEMLIELQRDSATTLEP